MAETKWIYKVDGRLEDTNLPRVDLPDWGDVDRLGLDFFMVGLATATNHSDAKIALSLQLIDHHEKHQASKKLNKPSNTSELLPEAMINRMLYGMVESCQESGNIPNAYCTCSS